MSHPTEYNQDKADVYLDRGSTLLLAALSVGPHIKPLRTETGLPHAFITNASWYLRRAKIWERRKLNYSWMSAYRRGLPEGIEGLTEDAAIAAGMAGTGSAFFSQIFYSAQREGRHKSWNGWSSVPLPECGTSVASGRHRRNGESCDKCGQADEHRRIAWLERKARIQAQHAAWRAERETQSHIDVGQWTELLEADKISSVSVWSSISLDAPLLWGNDNGVLNLYDRASRSYDRDQRNAHNVEWEDDTYDTAEPVLDNWLDGRRFVDLSFSGVRGEADEWSEGFSQGRRFTQRTYPSRHPITSRSC